MLHLLYADSIDKQLVESQKFSGTDYLALCGSYGQFVPVPKTFLQILHYYFGWFTLNT